MASNITITCPECDKALRISDDMLGKKIRCKGCGGIFPAREAAKKAGAKEGAGKGKAGKKGGDEEEMAYKMTEEYLGRRCPYCANAMEEGARICLSCGYDTLMREKANLKKVRDTTGGDIFMWLLPAILCAILTLILLGFDAYLWAAVDKDTFGGEELWYSALAGSLFTKVYVTVVILFISFFAGKFAIRRLVFNYMPPEIEEKMETAPR